MHHLPPPAPPPPTLPASRRGRDNRCRCTPAAANRPRLRLLRRRQRSSRPGRARWRAATTASAPSASKPAADRRESPVARRGPWACRKGTRKRRDRSRLTTAVPGKGRQGHGVHHRLSAAAHQGSERALAWVRKGGSAWTGEDDHHTVADSAKIGSAFIAGGSMPELTVLP